MASGHFLSFLPVWTVIIITILFAMLMAEIGFRAGVYARSRNSQFGQDAALGTIMASTLGLLAFLITFLTGVALTDFNQRRMLIVQDANAIGTAFLRAGYLPEPQQSTVRDLLRDVADLRLLAIGSDNPEEMAATMDALHNAVWAEAEALTRDNLNSANIGLFASSVNTMIDTYGLRAFAIYQALIPTIIWVVIYSTAGLSFLIVGLSSSFDGQRNWLALPALILTFSIVMMIIIELDRPQDGFLQVSQKAMFDLQAMMAATP